MPVEAGQRKTINVKWDAAEVKGDSVQLFVKAPGKGWSKVRDGKNDGAMTVTFPPEFTGSREVLVVGSEGGLAEGEIEVK
jgi:16S rRNA U1498 N3-methylase RsmE